LSDVSLFQPYYDDSKHIFQLLEFDVQDVMVVAGTPSRRASEMDGMAAARREGRRGIDGGKLLKSHLYLPPR
jgi:hypothetical protein